MEVLEFLKGLPLPFIILVLVIFLIMTVGLIILMAFNKGIEGIRIDVYKLILKAEHQYKENKAGKQKMKWVVSRARELLPGWIRIIVSEEVLMGIIDLWFRGVKDLLDDGKINESNK